MHSILRWVTHGQSKVFKRSISKVLKTLSISTEFFHFFNITKRYCWVLSLYSKSSLLNSNKILKKSTAQKRFPVDLVTFTVESLNRNLRYFFQKTLIKLVLYNWSMAFFISFFLFLYKGVTSANLKDDGITVDL